MSSFRYLSLGCPSAFVNDFEKFAQVTIIIISSKYSFFSRHCSSVAHFLQPRGPCVNKRWNLYTAYCKTPKQVFLPHHRTLHHILHSKYIRELYFWHCSHSFSEEIWMFGKLRKNHDPPASQSRTPSLGLSETVWTNHCLDQLVLLMISVCVCVAFSIRRSVNSTLTYFRFICTLIRWRH